MKPVSGPELHRLNKIVSLYKMMPGAPMPPMDDGYYLWGEMEGNDHWCFCEAIVDLIGNEVGALANEHQLV